MIYCSSNKLRYGFHVYEAVTFISIWSNAEGHNDSVVVSCVCTNWAVCLKHGSSRVFDIYFQMVQEHLFDSQSRKELKKKWEKRVPHVVRYQHYIFDISFFMLRLWLRVNGCHTEVLGDCDHTEVISSCSSYMLGTRGSHRFPLCGCSISSICNLHLHLKH